MIVTAALTGSHGTGKTTIISDIRQRAADLKVSTIVLTSPTRYVKSLGFDNNRNLGYKTEMMCLSLRFERQLSALQTAKSDIELHPKSKWLILADRCCLDELSYTREAIQSIYREANPTRSMDLRASRLQGVYNIFYDWVMEDVPEYWDILGYKPPHPDYPPEADDARLADPQYQFEVDQQVRYHFDKVKESEEFDAFQLDPELNVAVEEMWKKIESKLEL